MYFPFFTDYQARKGGIDKTQIEAAQKKIKEHLGEEFLQFGHRFLWDRSPAIVLGPMRMELNTYDVGGGKEVGSDIAFVFLYKGEWLFAGLSNSIDELLVPGEVWPMGVAFKEWDDEFVE